MRKDQTQFKFNPSKHSSHSLSKGSILQSTLTEEQSKQHGALISSLTEKASLMISTLDPDDKLNFLRVRSQKKEIMIAPDNDFLMMVIQNPNIIE